VVFVLLMRTGTGVVRSVALIVGDGSLLRARRTIATSTADVRNVGTVGPSSSLRWVAVLHPMTPLTPTGPADQGATAALTALRTGQVVVS